jgi:DNA mismatch endonuclease (patch repair protein)
MVDRVSEETRSYIMSRVGSKDTTPELSVRRLLHGLGYRYRLHAKRLPGSPDLCFPARRRVIFVHGCYWHGHDCRWGRLPKSRVEYWEAKIAANRRRDLDRIADLAGLGWSSLVIWQCETRDTAALTAKLVAFLGPPGGRGGATAAGAPKQQGGQSQQRP